MNVKTLGQVFSPDFIVDRMIGLIQNKGSILEPSCGDGAFLGKLPNHTTAIEIDSTVAPKNALVIDFFDFPTNHKFDTIIGNPPYVRYQDIDDNTKNKLDKTLFDERSNLYLFFIQKAINHLNKNGEIIFITPRDFLKATSSIKLNQFIYQNGTITHYFDLGDEKIFKGFNPNVAIWRFQKDNFSRITNQNKIFTLNNGQLLFLSKKYNVPFSSLFFVKVGAVSGADEVFTNEEFGNMEFVCSKTHKTKQTKKMIFNTYHPYLEQFKNKLINRKIKKFNEKNWFMWGRNHFISEQPRIYVNTKTRNKKPFFTHDCKNYDGSILALF
ncbi:MAG: class I SAM-dependent methyltransferase, partial [Thermonemataceae bacterium]|nr:class I SAM-dependent methyltransferase [Thermonemataceae bacterium]